jgi:hypothetical protein
MRRLFGALLMATGSLGISLGVWWIVTSRLLDLNPSIGARALAGVITSGLLCAFVGFVLLFEPERSG